MPKIDPSDFYDPDHAPPEDSKDQVQRFRRARSQFSQHNGENLKARRRAQKKRGQRANARQHQKKTSAWKH